MPLLFLWLILVIVFPPTPNSLPLVSVCFSEAAICAVTCSGGCGCAAGKDSAWPPLLIPSLTGEHLHPKTFLPNSQLLISFSAWSISSNTNTAANIISKLPWYFLLVDIPLFDNHLWKVKFVLIQLIKVMKDGWK